MEYLAGKLFCYLSINLSVRAFVKVLSLGIAAPSKGSSRNDEEAAALAPQRLPLKLTWTRNQAKSITLWSPYLQAEARNLIP
jgi:hypothetical protein